MPDTPAQFFLPGPGASFAVRESMLRAIRNTWVHFNERSEYLDSEWISDLSAYLDELAGMRINHVAEWMASNLSRFQASHANIETLRKEFDIAIADLKANVEICKVKCTSCHLFCLRPRRHDAEEPHDCQTDCHCGNVSDFGDEHIEEEKCEYPWVLVHKYCVQDAYQLDRAGHSGQHPYVLLRNHLLH